MFLWTAIAIALSAAIYWYVISRFDYWKSRGLPSTRRFLNLQFFYKKRVQLMQEIEARRYNKLGRIYGTYENGKPSISIADPDLIKKLLVTDFQTFPDRKVKMCCDSVFDKMLPCLQGKEHTRIRNVLTPAFTPGCFRRMMSVIEECCTTLRHELCFAIQNNPIIDVKNLFESFAMDITARTVLSMKVNAYGSSDEPFVVNVRKLLEEGGVSKKHLLNLSPKTSRVKCQSVALNFLRDIILKDIKERRESKEVRNDFLQLFLEASTKVSRSENGHNEFQVMDIQDTMQPNKDVVHEILSTDELVAHCISFFTMGYHSIVSVLSLVAYNLALNPGCQNRLIQEIHEATTDKKQTNIDCLNQMKYLNQVICETLRLYPPVTRLKRYSESEYMLGDTGIKISEGMTVTIPVCAIHRDINHYLNPKSFHPERFEDEYLLMRHPYAFIPFGAGQRNCLGMRLALIEIKASLVHLLQHIRFEESTETKIPLEFLEDQDGHQPKVVKLLISQSSS